MLALIWLFLRLGHGSKTFLGSTHTGKQLPFFIMIYNDLQIPVNWDGHIPRKISKLTEITGALNHTYPELSVARATLVFVKLVQFDARHSKSKEKKVFGYF